MVKVRIVAHILSFGDLRGGDQVGQSLGFFQHIFGEKDREPALQQDLFHGLVILIALVHDLDDFALGFFILFPFRDPHDDPVTLTAPFSLESGI